MTDDALETVRATLAAQEVAAAWPGTTRAQVLAAAPSWLAIREAVPWLATVELFRRTGEEPVSAAERLALYLTLHRETYGRAPTLEAVRRTHHD